MDVSDETGFLSPFSAGVPPDNLNFKICTFTNLIFSNLVSSILHKHLSFLKLGLEEDFKSHNVLALLLPGKIHIPKFTFSKRTP